MRRRTLTLLLLLAILVTVAVPVSAAAESDTAINRYNVMLVLDASGSMNTTDPYGLRYEAINLFTNLLAEEGNVLGGVVFSTDIDREIPPAHMNSQAEKDAVVADMRDVPYPGGWTNIGKGLASAVQQLRENGDEDLRSVIILLSDGNTAMPDGQMAEESLKTQKEAVQQLKDAEIPVYSVCLNCNGAADTSEMEQISEETEGVFIEVRRAEDLNAVFQAFYDLIYGTENITLADDVFPPEGMLETPFEVPGFGVEEVNIIVQGNTTDLALTKPDGSTSEPEIRGYDTFSAIKLTEVIPGEWNLRTWGVSGDKIKIEIVYNTNLQVELSLYDDVLQADVLEPGQPVSFMARLSAGDVAAASYEEYAGFSAELSVYNEGDEEIRRIPMNVSFNCFEASEQFEAGTYTFDATVTGNSFSKVSNQIGPLTFALPQEPEPEPEPEPERDPNTAPVASPAQVNRTVLIWPFAGGNTTLDIGSMVHDQEDPVLQYSAPYSTFRGNARYAVDAAGQLRLTLGNFQLKDGSVTVRATDSGGQYADVYVTVKVINTVVILLALLGIGLIVGLIFLLRNLDREKPVSGGTITVTTECDGVTKSAAPYALKKKGNVPLSRFGDIDNIGLDYNKSHFRSAGSAFIFLEADRPVRWRGADIRNVRIDSGVETTITVDPDGERKMKIRYDSDAMPF